MHNDAGKCRIMPYSHVPHSAFRLSVKGMPDTSTGGHDRNLRMGTPVWLHLGDMHLPEEPLAENHTVDVAVVGSGMSGTLITDAVLRTGKSVAVVDRLGLGRGSNPASTALLQFEIDQPLRLRDRRRFSVWLDRRS